MTIKLPENEIARLEALFRFKILDTEQDDFYDTITALAASIMKAPIASISLVDANRQWLKSKIGIDVNETPREVSFCTHTILTPNEPMIIKDARLDERFADNPYVKTEPGVRFYFGVPLVTQNQEAIGALCAVDTVPRKAPTKFQMDALKSLSKLIISQLELREFIVNMHGELEKANEDASKSLSSFDARYAELNQKCDLVLEKIKARRAKKK